MAKVMATGLAGFIGFHLGKRLLDRGDEVVGLDNLSRYYDVPLKEARLAQLGYERQGGRFYKLNLADRVCVARLFADERPNVVVNLDLQSITHSSSHSRTALKASGQDIEPLLFPFSLTPRKGFI